MHNYLSHSDFAVRHSSENDIVDGTTLILGSGNHPLTSTTLMNVRNVNSFSMLSRIQDASIICSQQARFKFAHIRKVEIVNASFIDYEMVDHAVLEFEYIYRQCNN